MSDEKAQQLVAELAQIKAELGELRRVVAHAGKLSGLPQWISLALVGFVVIAVLFGALLTTLTQ